MMKRSSRKQIRNKIENNWGKLLVQFNPFATSVSLKTAEKLPHRCVTGSERVDCANLISHSEKADWRDFNGCMY